MKCVIRARASRYRFCLPRSRDRLRDSEFTRHPLHRFLLFMALIPGLASAATLYVPMGGGNRIDVVDTSGGGVVHRIPDIINAHGLAITPDGRYLIAPSADKVPARAHKALNGAEHKHSPSGRKANTAPSPTGPTSGSSHVDIIRTTDFKIIRRIAFDTASHHIAASPDDAYAVITHRDNGSISIVGIKSATDPTAKLNMRNVDIGGAPAYALVSPDSRTIYISDMMHSMVSVIDAGTGKVEKRISVPGGPWHMALALNGRFLYTANVGAGTVSVISLSQGKVVRSYKTGGPVHGIDVSENDKRLFVADMADNRIVALDLPKGTQHIVSLPTPFHVTTVPGTGGVAVTSLAKPYLWMISEHDLHTLRRISLGGTGHQIAIAQLH